MRGGERPTPSGVAPPARRSKPSELHRGRRKRPHRGASELFQRRGQAVGGALAEPNTCHGRPAAPPEVLLAWQGARRGRRRLGFERSAPAWPAAGGTARGKAAGVLLQEHKPIGAGGSGARAARENPVGQRRGWGIVKVCPCRRPRAGPVPRAHRGGHRRAHARLWRLPASHIPAAAMPLHPPDRQARPRL
jgi:hypothetical protein